MKTFEYLKVSDLSEESLNNYGSQGWELVTVLNDYTGSVYLFKREKEAGPVVNSKQSQLNDLMQKAMEEAVAEWPGAKLPQVKYLKETLHIGLKEAKEFVDDYYKKYHY